MESNYGSRFSSVPDIDRPRSIFDFSHEHKTSFDLGYVIPIGCFEVLPGDTWQVTISSVLRLQTLLTPIMDNIDVDIHAFFEPMRLVYDRTKEFFGENTAGPWAQQAEYTIPKISSPSGGWNTNTIADYLGIPVGVEFNAANGLQPSALPFRCYADICNEYWRDQNVTQPLNIPRGTAAQTGSNGSSYINDVVNGGVPFKACRKHDLFSSCLPDPQKNLNPVTFPLISGSHADLHGHVPVYASENLINHASSQLRWMITPTNTFDGNWHKLAVNGTQDSHYADTYAYMNSETAPSQGARAVYPGNLFADLSTGYADLSSSVGSVTVNQLRLAFQMQKFYEQLARSGSRYRELVRGMFSTTVPDARVQVPEYLGGTRFPLTIHQIANTSQSSDADLGDLGAMSNTSDIHDTFIKSFTEHGYIIITACARLNKHNYPQGLDRMWTRETFWDFAWPTLACIGEQPIYKYEIDATIRSGEDRLEVFGYNENYIHYRTTKNRCSGEMRPGIANSLASWHLADYYTSMPYLSDDWMREDKSVLDRCLAVTSSVANQIFADFYFDAKVTRCLPVFSVPGLIDHF